MLFRSMCLQQILFRLGKNYWIYESNIIQRYKKYDAVLIPTSPIMPPDISRLMNDGDFYNSQNLLALRNTRIGNLMGGCSITLPTGVPSCGLLIMGMPNQEERLLRLAQACERLLSKNNRSRIS